VRDLGLEHSGRHWYAVKNNTQESDQHFILAETLYSEIRKHTKRCRRNLTRGPDIEFWTPNGEHLALEVETGTYLKKNLGEFENKKIPYLGKKFDDFGFVLTHAKLKKKYKKYGKVFSRTEIHKKIKEIFEEPEDE